MDEQKPKNDLPKSEARLRRQNKTRRKTRRFESDAHTTRSPASPIGQGHDDTSLFQVSDLDAYRTKALEINRKFHEEFEAWKKRSAWAPREAEADVLLIAVTGLPNRTPICELMAMYGLHTCCRKLFRDSLRCYGGYLHAINPPGLETLDQFTLHANDLADRIYTHYWLYGLDLASINPGPYERHFSLIRIRVYKGV